MVLAKDAKTTLWVVNMGKVKYGFRAAEDAYKDVGSILGVVKAKDTDDNVVLGSDNKPPKVYINTANGKSYKRFCDPAKLEALITKGSLNKKKINGENINSVRCVQ